MDHLIASRSNLKICLVVALVSCSPAEATITRTLEWHQEPGSEIQQCHVFKLDNDEPVEVDRMRILFAAGSHHVHIYRSDVDVPDEVSDCWQGIDWTRWQLVIGAQTKPIDWQLPAGRTVPLAARQQVLVQVHWLDATSEPLDGKIEIAFHTTERSDAHIGVMFGINKQTAMQPHERKVLRQWCPMPSAAQLVALMGHFHGLGQRYTVDARSEGADSGTLLYDALDEQTLDFQLFDPTLPVGAGLQFECDFFNYRDVPITWSADTKTGEHCNMVAYYYPAEDVSQFCIVEATEVSSLSGPSGPIAVGGAAMYELVLSEPAPHELEVRLASSDTDTLEVPASIAIAAGQRTAPFMARALRPGRATVSASLGSTGQTVITTIGGLVLSEVYVGPDQQQWIELANLSSIAVDLSRFSIGAGSADYTTTRVALAVTLPPHGCVVVGGPQLSSTQPPYAQAIDFSPDLGADAGDAHGIALFDRTADRLDAATIPYDALVYGIDNNSLLDPNGQLATVVPPAPPSATYARTSDRWMTQAVPTPGICEVQR